MLYVYISCLAFGILYSAVSAIFGSHGFDHSSGFDGGAHGHAGHDSGDSPSPFNPLVIASAITTFGAIGLIAKAGLGMADLLSLIIAIGFAGAIGAAIFFGVVKLVYNSQSNSVFSLSDTIGTEAEVITPLPKDGIGEIAYVINGIRYNLSAKSSENEEISRGSRVIIRDISQNYAIVQKKITLDDLENYETHESRKKINNNEM